MLIDDDFLSTSIDGEMEDGFYLKVGVGLCSCHWIFYIEVSSLRCVIVLL